MGHAEAPSWPCDGVVQVVRAHHGEARVDGAALALQDLVDGRAHVVVDAAPCHAAKGGEAARVRIEQHLVALARVRHEPERTARAQLHVRELQPPVDATDHEPLFAPVELERFAEFEGEWHEGLAAGDATLLGPPVTDEVREAGVTAFVSGLTDLLDQRLGVRRSFFGRRASTSSACMTSSTNGANLMGASSRRLRRGSSTLSVRRYLRTVLRDRLVASAISRTDFLSRRCIRSTLPIMAMVITPDTPLLKKAAE